MATTRGTTCPVCNTKKSTEYVALLPITRDGQDLQPHQYAVCPGCYRDQWAMVYGKDVPCPIQVETASKGRGRQIGRAHV